MNQSTEKLTQNEKHIAELDRLFIRIYENNVAGRVNDERFTMMGRNYEDEQAQLKAEIQELIPYALRELVKAIYIEAPDKSSGKRRQNIRIEYDLVG